MQPILHPEHEQLRQRCRQLQEALRETLREWFRLRTEVYPRLLAEYERLFGEEERERQRLSLQAAQLKRRTELLVLKLERGEPLTERTFALVEQIVEREFAQLWQRLKAAEEPWERSLAEDTAGEFPKLYRTLVKRLHPDALGTETEEFRQYWSVLQRAYRERNVHQLRQLHLLLCGEGTDASEGAIPEELEALRAYVRRLELRLAAEQRRLDRLRSEEPFCLPLTDPTWIEQRRRELQQEIEQRRRDIAFYSQLLERLRNTTFSAEELRDTELARHIAEQTYGRR
ncbi:hypothetical protein HRbin21_01090 [bacterium HR21]|nr:hypothetical protein HRbin21_01090 [bacterium HR21]